MTTLRQAAQQALDAIHLWHWAGETHLLMAAHDALLTALEQEHAMHDLARLGQEIEQAEPISTNAAMRDARLNAGWGSEQQAEPIGWLDGNDKLADFMHRDLKADHDKRGSATPREFTIPVYTAPPQQQAEPVAQRKPLTDAEIHNLDPLPHKMFDQERFDFARAIESAHNIKEQP